jgi:hypothetical protein
MNVFPVPASPCSTKFCVDSNALSWFLVNGSISLSSKLTPARVFRLLAIFYTFLLVSLSFVSEYSYSIQGKPCTCKIPAQV